MRFFGFNAQIFLLFFVVLGYDYILFQDLESGGIGGLSTTDALLTLHDEISGLNRHFCGEYLLFNFKPKSRHQDRQTHQMPKFPLWYILCTRKHVHSYIYENIYIYKYFVYSQTKSKKMVFMETFYWPILCVPLDQCHAGYHVYHTVLCFLQLLKSGFQVHVQCSLVFYNCC